MVGTDKQYVNSALSSLINFFRFFPQIELVDYDLDFILIIQDHDEKIGKN